MSILRTQQLTRTYGGRKGVERLSFEVQAGDLFGFLGPNGAGKSTTIRLLMGFLKPDAGSATIDGHDCWRDSVRVKQQVGYLPGDLRLYPWLTFRAGVAIVARIRGIDITARATHLAEQFELEPNLPVRKMSRGTRQKMGLVLAMAHRPALLILDEPTSGLDPLMQATLANLLREAAADGQTVFFSSHTLSEVESLCNRVAIVRRGRIIIDEQLAALRDRAQRVVELEYATPQQAADSPLPKYLERVRQDENRLVCHLQGPTPAVVAWAAGQPLVDIRIGKPDLEAVFHALYHANGEGQG